MYMCYILESICDLLIYPITQSASYVWNRSYDYKSDIETIRCFGLFKTTFNLFRDFVVHKWKDM